MTAHQGVVVVVQDGVVFYDAGRSFAVGPDGALVVLDEGGAELARFEVGNWRNVVDRSAFPDDD